MPRRPHMLRAPALLGLDEASRPESVQFGAHNLRAENVRQFRQGEASTRFGFAALSTVRTDATSATAGHKMFAAGDAVCRINEDPSLEVYSPAEQRWKSLGRVPEVTCKTSGLPSMGDATYLCDAAATNGYLAVAWISTLAYAAVLDQTTGAILRAPEQMGVGSALTPLLLSTQGKYFVAVHYLAAGTKLEAWYLDTTSPATIATGWVAFGAALAADADCSTGGLALCALPHATTPRVACLYRNTTGGTSRATLITFNVGGVVETRQLNTSSANAMSPALAFDEASTLWCAWGEALNVRAIGVSPFTIASTPSNYATVTSLVATVAAVRIVASNVAGKARIWAHDSAAPYGGRMAGLTTTAGATTVDGGAAYVVSDASMASTPFRYGSRYYAAFQQASSAGLTSNFLVCDWSDDANSVRPIANPSPDLAGSPAFGMAHVVADATGTKRSTVYHVTQNGVATGAALLTMDFADPNRWQTAACAGSVYMSGGVASCFDGQRAAEAGFLVRPATPTLAMSGTGTLTLASGRRYVCVYEEVDAAGAWHQSGISSPSASTGPITTDTVAVTTSALSLSSRVSGPAATRSVRVAFYGTINGNVAPYYRLGTVLNAPGGLSITFYDQVSDATLGASAKLYSQPGVLGTAQDHRSPPPFSCVASYNGMLCGASGSDIWYSGQVVSGEGVWFSPIFQVPVPGDGDITALWVQDGSLFAAKRSAIYAFSGEPPSDNGSSGGLGAPRRLAVDIGAIGPVVCPTSDGVFFLSERGLEVFTRAQTVEWVGKAIQGTLAAFPIVTAITLDPSNSGTLLIELAASQSGGLVTGTGRTLVYDISRGSGWISTDRRTSSAGVADAPAQSACLLSTASGWRYGWLTAGGVVHVEDRTTNLDANGSFVVPLIETGWFDGFTNEMRVWRASILFQRYTAAGLKVERAYDFGDYSALDDAVWTETNTDGQRQLEWSPSPRGESMKFRITTTAPATLGTGQGIGAFGMLLDLEDKQGPAKGTLRIDPALRR